MLFAELVMYLISTASLLFQQIFAVSRTSSCFWCILFAVHAGHYLHANGFCYQQGKIHQVLF